MRKTIETLRGEFLEMPGMRLTAAQVQRLCGVAPGPCHAALAALVTEGFLSVNADGRYGRLTDGDGEDRPARAHVRSARKHPVFE